MGAVGAGNGIAPYAVVLVVALVASAAATYLYFGTNSRGDPTGITSQCCNSKNNFRIVVSYGGAWRVTYIGYEGMETKQTATGSYSGNGSNQTVVDVPANSNVYGVYLCASATKLDNSNSNLTLSIYWNQDSIPLGGLYNTTSAPQGSVKACGGLVP